MGSEYGCGALVSKSYYCRDACLFLALPVAIELEIASGAMLRR